MISEFCSLISFVIIFNFIQDSNFFLFLKEEEEEDLNDREVDDEDEEGEFNSGWCKLGARSLIKTIIK